MASGRWYPSTLTLNDSRVLVVGGVAEASEAGYVADPAKRAKSDNPTFTVFNLATRCALLPHARWCGVPSPCLSWQLPCTAQGLRAGTPATAVHVPTLPASPS